MDICEGTCQAQGRDRASWNGAWHLARQGGGGQEKIIEPFCLEKSSKIFEPRMMVLEWEGTYVQLDLDVC